jgi:hypothetical protein
MESEREEMAVLGHDDVAGGPGELWPSDEIEEIVVAGCVSEKVEVC